MLPFQDVQEAEANLGRPLSYAEILWFNYTAGMPDFMLYFLNFVLVVCVFSLYPLPVNLLELKAPEFINSFKIQPNKKTTLGVMLNGYKDVMINLFLVLGPLHLTSYWYPLSEVMGIMTSLPLPSVWEVGAQLVVYFLVDDYGQYWLHRWLHCSWAYDRIHHVHHELTAPTGFAAQYAHWAEILILGIPSFAGPALVPCHIVTLWLWTSLLYIESIDTHNGYNFPWSLTKLIPFYGGADFHDYHHYIGRYGKSNFAPVFTYCDFIYGTDKGYCHHKRLRAEMRKTASEEKRVLHISSHDLKSR